MAKTKLRKYDRDTLEQYAREAIDCAKERKAEERAHAKAAAAVRKVFEAKFPPDDMLVLKKYDATHDRANPVFQCADASGKLMHFQFGDIDAPLVPAHAPYRAFLVTEATYRALTAWAEAKHTHKQARYEKLLMYRSLISAARYVEDIEDAWPASKEVCERIRKNRGAVSVISDDLKRRVRADNAKVDEAA